MKKVKTVNIEITSEEWEYLKQLVEEEAYKLKGFGKVIKEPSIEKSLNSVEKIQKKINSVEFHFA